MSGPAPDRSSEVPTPEQDALRLLSCGDLEIHGLLPYASNATLLATVKDGDAEALCVYKPRRGERPLWDFPSGTLCEREFAAWVVDQALGWGLVPPTVLRDGPAGYGAVQLYVEEDPSADPRQLPQTHPRPLRELVLFDVIANNADRKAGHCLVDTDGKLWAIDHGICFHADPKLRTVIWVYAGEPIPPDLSADLERFHRAVASDGLLDGLLGTDEIEALRRRSDSLLRDGLFPRPGPGHRVPWPPW